ncbi:MAG TPA: PstC family ABC transporter permease [Candidatus Brocadiia bacterium]|nr:PstC family ABC transporter permease [Candidatus Brocadiia bacterium]
METPSAVAQSRQAALGGDGRCRKSLSLSKGASRLRWLGSLLIHGALFSVTAVSAVAVILIFVFVARDAIPFFMPQDGATAWGRIKEFFTDTRWYPSGHPPVFGALAMFVGSALVTLGAALVAVPLGVCAAVCLSDIMPFGLRQYVKPVIEMLAAIPSVAYGFFALVIVAPLLQERGGALLSAGVWMAGAPAALLAVFVASDMAASRFAERRRFAARAAAFAVLGAGAGWVLWRAAAALAGVTVASGTNALNVSVILGVMALPTVVSVSEDALQAVGGGLREGSYALGATRAETLSRVVIPAAGSGIAAAAILGVMRAVGETMVVWMASGNAAQIPTPWYNLMQPVRTLTATIAGDMGEADHVTGSARYSVLFAMALCLVTISFALNLASEWAIRRARKRLG